MRVVVDANIVAAALVRPTGWTASELSRQDVEWYAPEPLFAELEEHTEEFAALAGCAPAAFRRRVTRLTGLRVVKQESLVRAADHPLVRRAEMVDPDDAVYMAAVVAVGADHLWTRDRRLLAAFPGLAVRVVPLVTS